jgi:flavorubredoxin
VTPKAKIAGVFGSFGWSGEAVKLVEERLRGLRFKLPVPALTLRFTPTEDNLRECREFAAQLAAKVVGQEAA